MQLEANHCNCRCQANLLLKKGNAAVLPETDIRFDIYIYMERNKKHYNLCEWENMGINEAYFLEFSPVSTRCSYF